VSRAARAAFVFLTRIPVGGHPYTADEWRWAPAYFPLVGLVVGGLLAALDVALAPLGATADATLVVAASLLLTGALHEDGLADTSDAMGGGFERQRVLEILKDSRIGAFGACALIVSVVVRVGLLAELGRGALWALPLVGCAARVAPVWQLIALPHVSPQNAKSRDFAAVKWPQAIAATMWLVGSSAIAVGAGAVSPHRMIALAALLATTTAFTAWRYARRIGGLTGDFLGATEQVCEVAGYAVLAWGTR
jgi:adenosylcobinamide-GDP ribazoletransferase